MAVAKHRHPLKTLSVADQHVRTVYSTATAGKCPVCGWPQRDCTCSRQLARDEPLPSRIVAKLRMEKKGRGGKTVTVVYDLPDNQAFLKNLAAELKRSCGTGGSAVERGVEIQGDMRDRIRELLTKKGWVVKGS
jgi:translation initiation factor 1